MNNSEKDNDRDVPAKNSSDKPEECTPDNVKSPSDFTPIVTSDVVVQENIMECLVCNAPQMSYICFEIDLPYLGKCLQTTLNCRRCHFRHTDFILTTNKTPIKLSYLVQTEEDMAVRVVKSSSATIRIQELGITVEPGPASEAYISNIEGVLDRLIEGVEKAVLLSDVEDAEEKGRVLIGEIEKAIDGKRRLLLEILDPFGNSAIISEKTIRENLTPEEASQLKTGMIEFRVDALDKADN
ncbi:MAG: ZPR1 zinc finger domain-containing protein [Thermoplasmata archaeon]